MIAVTHQRRDTLLGVIVVTAWAVCAFGIAWVMIHPDLIFGYR